jgi:hypothetical protein
VVRQLGNPPEIEPHQPGEVSAVAAMVKTTFRLEVMTGGNLGRP